MIPTFIFGDGLFHQWNHSTAEGIRLLHLCEFHYADVVLTLAYASVYFRGPSAAFDAYWWGFRRLRTFKHLTFMGFYGVLLDFIGFYGVLWGFMGFYGVLWGFMGFYGVLWGFMGLYGALWGFKHLTKQESYNFWYKGVNPNIQLISWSLFWETLSQFRSQVPSLHSAKRWATMRPAP